MSLQRYIPEFDERLITWVGDFRRTFRLIDRTTGEYVTLTGRQVELVWNDEAGDGVFGEPVIATISGSTATVDTDINTTDLGTISSGRRYRELWYVYDAPLEPIAAVYSCDVYTTRASIAPPFVAASITAMYPDILGRYPYGQTSWIAQIEAVRATFAARIVSRITREGDVVGMLDFSEWWRHSLAAAFLRAVSGGAPGIVAIAADHERLAEAAWPRATVVTEDGTWASGEVEQAIDADGKSPSVVL